jgi:hypothetical protein
MPRLDRDRMPVQIMKNEPFWLKALFIYEPRHTLTTLDQSRQYSLLGPCGERLERLDQFTSEDVLNDKET